MLDTSIRAPEAWQLLREQCTLPRLAQRFRPLPARPASGSADGLLL
jgi:hypothetical protein